MRWVNRTVLMVIVSVSIQAWAQAPHASTAAVQADPFAPVQTSLNTAADNILAIAAERPLGAQIIAAPPNTSEVAEALNVPRSSPRGNTLQRVEQQRPVSEPILREEGVPTELIAVVLIESGGQPAALSPKGARGLWQFMPDTARRYGLIVSAVTDERLDIQKSTRAAARYLRDLYQRFGNWSLALAAYNAVEDRVDAASWKAQSAEFVRLSAWLPLETRNYVPAVLSAMGQVLTIRPARLLAGGARNVLYAAASLD